MRRLVLASLLATALALPAGSALPQEAGPPPAAAKVYDPVEQDMVRMLDDGAMLLRQGQPRRAIDEHFDKILASYEGRYRDTTEKVYAAGSVAEVTAYMLMAAGQGRNAVAVSQTWAAAHFMKGYALVELKDYAAARASLERARDLSPLNPQFLNELGNIYKAQREWDLALTAYQAAREHAPAFSAPGQQDRNLLTADHGIAFVYSETGKLDEAEAIYRECLRKFPEDSYARHELGYIEHMRRQNRG